VRTVSVDRLKFGVAEQREIQFLLGLELRLCFDGIGATAENDRAKFVKFWLCVAKLGRFRDSTGSLGLGEKIKDHPLSAQI
jgi:hypothetical protein